MPVFLEAPAYQPGGPDGLGWNRLSLNAHFGQPAQCALLPRTYAALRDCQDTRRSAWGPYEQCVMGAPKCTDGCPVWERYRAGRDRIPVNSPRVAVRVTDHFAAPDAPFNAVPYSQLWVTDRPEAGNFREHGEPWTFPQMARLHGWVIGRAFRDEHGGGFWIERTEHVQAPHAEIKTREWSSSARHAVLVPGGRAALLTCFRRPCAHGPELLNVITQHAPDRDDEDPLPHDASAARFEAGPQHRLTVSFRRRSVVAEFWGEQAGHAHMQLELSGSGWTRERVTGAVSALVTHHGCGSGT